jgi:TRAP transporter TAXI family solute receptor
VLEEALGWKRSDLKLAAELKSAEMSQAVCDNKIDAYFWLVGHPSGSTKEATTLCSTVIVEVTGPVIDKLIAENSFYRVATIPGGMYTGNPNDVMTYGVGATFVSSTKTPPEVIYQVVKAVFDNFKSFKKLHPAFANLKESEMIKDGLSAPLHEGAIRYYKERGWM